ncbi:hypothetical protein LUX09_05260 [Streptomyces albogriseolus]|nr:hypothetical protein [Streptomyces albogriseolus]
MPGEPAARPPKQDESEGYGTRYGGLVTVQGDTWSCTGCGRTDAPAGDVHHDAQRHATECLAVSYGGKQ